MPISLSDFIPFYYPPPKINPQPVFFPETIKQALPKLETFQCREMTPQRRAQWIAKLAKLTITASSISTSENRSNLIIHFTAQFWGVLYKVFTLSQRSTPMISAYEIHCMVLAYFNLGNLLFMAMKGIAKMAPTRQAAILYNGALIGGFFGSMWIYTRCRDSNQIEFCKRVTSTKVPYFSKQDYSVIQNNSAVVIHGLSGVRKSTYVQGIAAALGNKQVFQVKNSLVFTPNANANNTGVASSLDKLTYIIDEIKKNKDAILICDEFGIATIGLQPDQKVLNEASLTQLGQMSLLLKEYPHLKIVVVMETSQWKAIVEADKALAYRFKDVQMQAPDDDEKRAILNAIATEEAPHIVDKAAIEQMIALSKSTEGFHQTILFFRALIKTVLENRKQLPVPKELENARQAHALFQADMERADSPLNDPMSLAADSFFEKEDSAKQALDTAQTNFAALQNKVSNYVKLDALLQSRLQERNRLAREWLSVEEGKRPLLSKKIDYIEFAERPEIERAKAALRPELKDILLDINVAAVKAFDLQRKAEAGIPIEERILDCKNRSR